MKFTKFSIKNFRGINSTTLDLSKASIGAVNILVGLNESGKTTILEAINDFRSNPNLKKPNPNSKHRSADDFQAMIPISKRALFNDATSVTATLEMSPVEREKINSYLKSNFNLVETQFPTKFTIQHKISFENSLYKKINNTWSLTFEGRKRKGATPFKDLSQEDWQKTIKYVETLLPKVMYFPAALLEFPNLIPLEQNQIRDKKPVVLPNKDSFYYEVLVDLIQAIDKRLDIEKHLIERAKSSSRVEIQNLEALIQQIENHLNRTILGAWREILNTDLGDKKFRLIISKNDQGLVCAEIKLSDSTGLFSLAERSAGFRWFFAFIMLVAYRANRDDNVLFLFDEPAANLHPRAQAKLLNSFSHLPESYQFILTTHSHYLVNPLWLESTFIVKNEASSATDDGIGTEPSKTSITITPYRKFVGSHPDQHFYYKPVMDALEYSPSRLAPGSQAILIEGKTDYYCLELFKRYLNIESTELCLFPGGGSGTLDPLISILAGWGSNFLIVLDGDASGISESKRYREKFEKIVDGKIFTLSEILEKSTKTLIENLISNADKEKIRKKYFSDEAKLTKKLLHKAIQELLFDSRKFDFDESTTTNFRELIGSLQFRMNEF